MTAYLADAHDQNPTDASRRQAGRAHLRRAHKPTEEQQRALLRASLTLSDQIRDLVEQGRNVACRAFPFLYDDSTHDIGKGAISKRDRAAREHRKQLRRERCGECPVLGSCRRYGLLAQEAGWPIDNMPVDVEPASRGAVAARSSRSGSVAA